MEAQLVSILRISVSMSVRGVPSPVTSTAYSASPAYAAYSASPSVLCLPILQKDPSLAVYS